MSLILKSLIQCMLLLLGLNSFTANAATLKVGYGQHNTPPYTKIDQQKLVGGIIKNLMDAVAQELDINVVYKPISRMREEQQLLNGEIDLIVISNPKWLKHSDKFNWSIPLFSEKDLFVVATKRPIQINNFNDLQGKHLGTIRGYYYQGLMAMFEQKIIIREDVENIGQNFNKLRVNRIDAFIDSNILIRYYLKNNGNEHFTIANKVASSHFIHSALSPHLPISVNTLNEALEKLKKSGKIEAILKSYQ